MIHGIDGRRAACFLDAVIFMPIASIIEMYHGHYFISTWRPCLLSEIHALAHKLIICQWKGLPIQSKSTLLISYFANFKYHFHDFVGLRFKDTPGNT